VSATHVALLRGINVGGNNKLAMADLVKLFAAAGAKDVATYIQSGNVLFRAGDAAKIATAVEAALAKKFELQIPIVLRTAAQLAAVVKTNPHITPKAKLEKIYVGFLATAPAAERIALLDPARSPGDEAIVIGAEIYLRYGNGAGKTKLTNAYFDSKLATISTMRNWNTVLKLHELVTASATA
jgi:uncharacterized protein (DUF1697 family)